MTTTTAEVEAEGGNKDDGFDDIEDAEDDAIYAEAKTERKDEINGSQLLLLRPFP